MGFFDELEKEEKKPKPPKIVTPRPRKPVLTKEKFRIFLNDTLTVESFENVVKQEKTSSAEFLNVKLNPKGKNKAYNRRNKRRYSITFKATLEIAKELLIDSFEGLKHEI